MTVSNTTRTAGPYFGTGLVSVYGFGFKVFLTTDVLVQITSAAGVLTTGVLGTDYTVTLNADQDGSPGGTVNLTTPLAASAALSIGSQVPLSQQVVLTTPGGFYPKVISDALDKLTILIQQALGSIGSALRLPEIGSTANVLPAAAQRANNLLGFDAAGNPITVAPVAGTATALSASLISSIGGTLVSWLQLGVNAITRTITARFRDTLHVTDFATVQDAVTQAYAVGARLFFPAGNYPVVGSIAHFHDIVKLGPGVITRDAATFPVQPVYNNVNTLYIDVVNGVDTNDGLTPALPMKTAARVAALIPLYGLPLNGSWTFVFAAGTDGGGITWPEDLYGFGPNRLTLQGPIVGDPVVPTFIIDGTVGAQSFGWNFNSRNKLTLSNIKFTNCSTFGWVSQDGCDITDVNVHVSNIPNGPGKKMQGPGRWRSIGGISSACQSGLAAIGNVVFTFSSVKSNNNTQAGIALQEGATGHVDNSSFNSNPIHIDATVRSRAHVLGSAFTNAVTAHCRGQVLCDFYDNPTTPNSFDITAPAFLMYGGSVLTATQSNWTNWLDKPVDLTFITQTGTTSATVVKTYVAALAANSFESSVKAYKVRVSGELTGTAGTKNIVVNVNGSPAFGFTIPAAATGSYLLEGILNANGTAAQSYDASCLSNSAAGPQVATGSRSINMYTGAALPMTVVVTMGSAADTLTVRKVQESTRGGC